VGGDLADLFFKYKDTSMPTNKTLIPKEKTLQKLEEINPVVCQLLEESGLV